MPVIHPLATGPGHCWRQADGRCIEQFAAALDAEHGIGFRIASFGGVVLFHAEKIGFANPDLVTFVGTTDDGERVQLVQHVTQLSFLLRAVVTPTTVVSGSVPATAPHRAAFHAAVRRPMVGTATAAPRPIWETESMGGDSAASPMS